MNNLLQLKGRFEQRKSNNRPGAKALPKGAMLKSEHIEKISLQLKSVYKFWENNKIISNALVSIYYKNIIAKSNRISRLLSFPGGDPKSTIVGAKFTDGEKKHIITHCIPNSAILSSIDELQTLKEIIDSQYNGCITDMQLEDVNKKRAYYDDSLIKRSNFSKLIVDLYYIEKVGVEVATETIDEEAIVSIYDTGTETSEILEKLGIELYRRKTLDDTTFLLLPEDYKKLVTEAPYLVAMAVKDIAEFDFETTDICEVHDVATIPKPSDEPTIGVIDSPFDTSVYFSEWVTPINLIDEGIPINRNDYDHGTKVSSIIVDGANINPEMDDGCGRFKVRHFAVAGSGKSSSFSVIQSIKKAVRENPDIKVWNLSLGSILPINRNFISPEAAVLDQIQFENDVIFVIAGTNKPDNIKENMKIGAPADSINSIVINSVDFDNKPATYSREGMVLSFYNKPDVSYYGGDYNQKIRTCSSNGESFVAGTSFAAPWISRKLAYLIHNIGLSREVAKALLIDSAIGWDNPKNSPELIGHGIVPQNIREIVASRDDEIRFVLSGVSEKYDTYAYNLPVPVIKNSHPYIARATLCYFPKCSRNQGVDYTNSELDLHFGRIKNDGSIDTINNNKQSDDGFNNITESKARDSYRKWDNVKYIVEYFSNKKRPKKAYDTNMYGISLKTKERLDNNDGEGIRFGIVVTLKEINGENRIDEFIRQCILKSWIVSEINIENQLSVYATAEENIVFEDE